MREDLLGESELRPYVQEILNQAQFAMYAWNALQTVLTSIKTEGKSASIPGAFWLIHSFLTHAAMISKTFMPTGTSPRKRTPEELRYSRARSHQLRALFDVDDESPIVQRRMRDHLEHFDERLDHWNANSRHRNSLDMSFIAVGSVSGLEDLDHFRVFDPDRFQFRFRNEAFDLMPVADEMLRLQEKAARWIREFHTRPW